MEEDLLSDKIWLIVFQERMIDLHWTAPSDKIEYLIGVCLRHSLKKIIKNKMSGRKGCKVGLYTIRLNRGWKSI